MQVSKKSIPDRVTQVRKPDKKVGSTQRPQLSSWWLAKSDKQRADELLSTVAFLKQGQMWRHQQAGIFARMYSNQALMGFVGSQIGKFDAPGFDPGRPTYNLCSSVIDTLVSKLTQSRPAPVFLTDNSDYKERNLAKKLNNFILGEFYQTKAYEHGEYVLRDALMEGTGCLHVYETDDHKVGLERVFLTELFTDLVESMYGDPRQLYRVKLIDRMVLASRFPKYAKQIADAERTTIDGSVATNKSTSDMVLVVEGWRLPSGEKTGDGRHTLACSAGLLFDEQWTKKTFPFVFLHHRKRPVGFWSIGVCESLMGTQMELNQLLATISRSIRLVGVPRVFIEEGSKVMNSSINNQIGVLVKYRGTKPSYETAPCVPQEMYQERDRIIQYGYQQEGLSFMAASAQKPAGLDSGEAIRTYDDINTDRFASTARRYDNFYIDLAYLMIDQAKDIAERDGEYQTVYPDKKGSKHIDLPKLSLLKDPFVIQCFNESSLPRDPAGRLSKVTEMVQSGMLTIQEGRRLMDFSDLQQIETLANAGEERIYWALDEIIESGEYNPPDPFMNLKLAAEITTQYINLYCPRKLEKDKAEKLRSFFTQAGALMQAAMPPAPMPVPQAAPMPLPQSPLVPNAVGASAAA